MNNKRRPRGKPGQGDDKVDKAAATAVVAEVIAEAEGADAHHQRPDGVVALGKAILAEGVQAEDIPMPQADDDANDPYEDREDPDDDDYEGFKAEVRVLFMDLVEELLEPRFNKLDKRSRDRTGSILAEATGRAATIEDGIEELQNGIRGVLDDLNSRMERVEESCGLRPSLLTTAEAAVARLDEMARGGSLRAEDVRTIHRTLRAAVQEERAKRQGSNQG